MAQYDCADARAPQADDAEALYEFGIVHASGRSAPVDLVSAHKWFNIAASRGNAEAIRMRREIAEEMSEAEVATAQRAARDWTKNAKEGTVRTVGANISALPVASAATGNRQAA